MINNTLHNYELCKKTNAIALALCLWSGYIGYFAEYINIGIKWGLCNLALALSSLFFTIPSYKCNNQKVFTVLLPVLAAVILNYFISVLFFSSELKLYIYIYVCVVPCIVLFNDVNIRITIKILMYSSIILLFFYRRIFEIQYFSINQSSMGISYLVANVLIASILNYFYYDKKEFISFTLYAISFFLLVQLLLHGVRGAVLTIVLVSILVFQNKIIKNRMPAIIVLYGMLYYIYSRLEHWVYYLNNLFEKNGLEVPAFIVKMSIFLDEERVSNGRDILLSNALDIARQCSMFGLGINNFGKEYFMRFGEYVEYPHNFLLQTYIECGLFVFLTIALVITFYFIKIICNRIENKDQFCKVVFFLSLIIPRYVLSLNIWAFLEIWIGFFGLLFICLREKEYSILNSNAWGLERE